MLPSTKYIANMILNLKRFLFYYFIKYLDLIAKHFILIAIKKVFIYFYEFT